MRKIITIILLCTFFSSVSTQTHKKGAGYEWFCQGLCNGKCVKCVTPSSGLLLAGGGTEVDEAFKWLISKAGGGNIVVLRASGTDALNPYIYGLGNIESVATIVFSSSAGSKDSWVNEKILEATGIFIAGGDQAKYMTFWNNTILQQSLQTLYSRGVPIGGTSAGMAILGQYVYTAAVASVTSPEALANPYISSITIATDFLKIPIMKGLITDTHFYERDRMGRFVTFLARIKKDHSKDRIVGIACDEATAVLVDGTQGRVVTQKATQYAYFAQATNVPSVCVPNQKLSIDGVQITRVGNGQTFDLNSWSSTVGKSYILESKVGVLSTTGNNGAIY